MSAAETPTPEQQPKPETPAQPKEHDAAYAAALKSISSERDALAEQVKARDAQIAALTGERDAARAQVDLFGKQQREGAIVEAIRAKLPHLGAFEIRSTLLGLAEEGAVDRYSDKPEDAAAAALAAMQSKAPALLRPPPAQGGGPNGAPPQPQGRKTKSLVWGLQ